MKTHLFVSVASVTAVLLAVAALASAPFRFPGASIAWGPALLFLSPAIMLVVLTLIKPAVSRKMFLSFLLFFSLLVALGTIAGRLPVLFTAIFTGAAFLLYFSGSSQRASARQ